MKKILFIILINTINIGVAQNSLIYNDFYRDYFKDYNYFNFENCKDRNFNQFFLDSIYSYFSDDFLQDKDLIFKMRSLETLYCMGNNDYIFKGKNSKLVKTPLTFPSSIKNLFFEGQIPIPLPFNFDQNINNLTKLYFFELAISRDQISKTNDSLFLDFSNLDSLKEFGLIISNWYSLPVKIKVVFPQNIKYFYGVIDNKFYPIIFPKTIEEIDIAFGNTIPPDFFELSNLKTLFINNNVPLTSEFIKFKKIKKLKITHITSSDIEIISQMSSLDTLLCNIKVDLNIPLHQFSKAPENIENLKIKCIVLKGSNFPFKDYIKELAKNIKIKLPNTKVYYFINNYDIEETHNN